MLLEYSMNRYILSLFIAFLFTGIARAQYDAQFSQYFMAMGYYNPAYAGVTGDLNTMALYRMQWVGMERAPKSIFATADMPLRLGKTNHGVGVTFFSESIGLFQNIHLSGQYAFKFKLFGGSLSLGLQGGIANRSFDGSKVKLLDSDYHQSTDEAIPANEVNGMALDINAGFYYTHKNFYLGAAATHITEPEIDFTETITTYIGRAYNFTAGYNIKTGNPLFELQPSVFMKTDLQSFQADITGRVIYNKMFNGGVSWRVNESVVILLGATFENIQVGYAYDYPTSPIIKASSGSHEIMARFRINLNKTKSGTFKHKSVRIL